MGRFPPLIVLAVGSIATSTYFAVQIVCESAP